MLIPPRQPEVFDKPIYLDHQASTPIDPIVAASVYKAMTESIGNPASDGPHGRAQSSALDGVRSTLRSFFGVDDSARVVFTSGATESNNLAIRGIGPAHARNRVVVGAVEHDSVYRTCHYMSELGYEVVELPVDRQGRYDIEAAAEIVDERVALLAVMTANNEVGTVQPISLLLAIAHKSGAMVHVDATQSCLDAHDYLNHSQISSIALSSHKIYGPPGVGALVLRSNSNWQPLLLGGAQEYGIRAGTQNVPGVVGLGTAIEILMASGPKHSAHLSGQASALYDSLRQQIPGVELIGCPKGRLAGNVTLLLPGDVEAVDLMRFASSVSMSQGSACSVGHHRTSRVHAAMGFSPKESRRILRLGVGRFTTPEEVFSASCRIGLAFRRCQELDE